MRSSPLQVNLRIPRTARRCKVADAEPGASLLESASFWLGPVAYALAGEQLRCGVDVLAECVNPLPTWTEILTREYVPWERTAR
jgi:hypothetical protein